LVTLIEEAGFEAVERDTVYNPIARSAPNDTPSNAPRNVSVV
jgi:2-iminoacetate synthase ThiH